MQVLMNLGSNAIKYNRRGGLVCVDAKTSDDGWLRISVTDTGPGISAERHSEVFEPFNRLGAERGETEGTGIGLAISKQLMELMAGRIDFVSEFGRGSTFWIELPQDPTADSVAEEASPATLGAIARKAGRTVLCVDDNPPALVLLARLVAGMPDTRVLTASTGQMAVAIAIAHRPDLVITDIHLPDLNGYDLLERDAFSFGHIRRF
jgi:hypothetical protein